MLSLQVLDPALAFLVATLARDQRIAEALCRISTSAFSSSAAAQSNDDETIYDEPTCDVLSVLRQMLGRSWAGEEIGKKDQKGLSKSDARTVSVLGKSEHFAADLASAAPHYSRGRRSGEAHRGRLAAREISSADCLASP